MEQRISDLYGPSGGRIIDAEATRDLINVTIRLIVADMVKKSDRKISEGELGKILVSHDMEKIMEKVAELSLNAQLKDILKSKDKKKIKIKKSLDKYKKHKEYLNTTLLWLKIAELFNCNAVGDYEIKRAKEDLKNNPTPNSLNKFVEEIFTQWERTNRLLSNFKKTNGRQLRQGVYKEVKPLLDKGAAILVLRKGHYVFLVEVNEIGIILNDPAGGLRPDGSMGKNSKHTWASAAKFAFFRAFHVFFHPDKKQGNPWFDATGDFKMPLNRRPENAIFFC